MLMVLLLSKVFYLGSRFILEIASSIMNGGILISKPIFSSKSSMNLLMSIVGIALGIFSTIIGLTMCYKVMCDNVLVLAPFTVIVNELRAIL
jgi:hypothetical protein